MKNSKAQNRQRRHFRVRAKVEGTESRPRLNVSKSNKGIYAQVINDETGQTIASSSTLTLKLSGNNIENAAKVGTDIAKKAMAAGVNEVVFDRGGNLYHGKIKSLADAARQEGLKF